MKDHPDLSKPVFAYFLIQLETRLRLPDKIGFRFPRFKRDHIEWYERIAQGGAPDDPDDLASLVSICHHVTELANLSKSVGLWKMAETVLPWTIDHRRSHSDNIETPGRPISVLEVAVSIDNPAYLALPDDREEEGPFPPLIEAIEAVQELQSIYYVATGEPIPHVSATTLPMIVPCIFGELSESGPTYVGSRVLMNQESSEWIGWSDEILAPEPFNAAVAAVQNNHPFLRYLDLLREAEWILRTSGNAWASLILSATAAEHLINTVLELLLWEERLKPVDASAHFPLQRGITRRAELDLAPRLGGDWSGKSSTVVQAWKSDVADRRNLALHRAAPITAIEGARALEAIRQLEVFVTTRLSDPKVLAKFPMAGLALMGEPGLRKRGLWSERLRGVAATADIDFARFSRWANVLAANLADLKSPRSPEIGGHLLVGIVDSANRVYWAVHAFSTRMAAPVVVNQSVVNQVSDTLRTIRAIRQQSSDRSLTSFVVQADSGDWHRTGAYIDDHWLIPGAEAMRAGDDLTATLNDLEPDYRL